MRTDLKNEIDLLENDSREHLAMAFERFRRDVLRCIIWTGVGVTITLGSFLGAMIARI